MDSKISEDRPFQVLSLSGGGFLGLYSALLLEKLEGRFGGPLAGHFDLICGTSVGGVIALGIAAEKPVAEIRGAIERHGRLIFPRPAGVLRSLRRAMYSTTPLRRAVEEIVGDDLIVGDLKHRVLIPTVNLTKGGPTVFKTPHHKNLSEDWRHRVVDVALATSAAPTLFPTSKIGDRDFADGGLYANSPDLLGVHEAEHFLGVDRSRIRVLSIGTTTKKFSFESGEHNKGIWPWMTDLRIFNVMLSSQQQTADYMMQHSFGDRYVRLDIEPSTEQTKNLRLDIANEKSIDTQKGLAETTFQEVIPNKELRSFFDYDTDQPIFYHGPHAAQDVSE